MAYKYFDNNPVRPNRGDCVIRAISKVMNQSWDRTYWDLCNYGFNLGDWGDSNKVWDSYLRDNGFVRKVIPDTCPDCYTVADFTYDHADGEYILATGNHTVAVINGDFYDSWNSSSEPIIFYYER